MDGLQSVAHIGQCPADDHAHRVIDIRPPHLIFDIYRNQIGWRGCRWYWRCSLVCHEISSCPLNIEILHFERIVFDEFAAGLNGIPHQDGEDIIRIHGILDLYLE